MLNLKSLNLLPRGGGDGGICPLRTGLVYFAGQRSKANVTVGKRLYKIVNTIQTNPRVHYVIF